MSTSLFMKLADEVAVVFFNKATVLLQEQAGFAHVSKEDEPSYAVTAVSKTSF